MTEALVLCYHAVSPTWDAALSVTPDALERQLAWLVSRGWRASTFADALHRPAGERTLVITFDDAFASVGTLAHPILSSLGLTATVFVPTDPVTQGLKLAWPGTEHWLRTRHAAELSAMTWQQLGALNDAGWEIGSHTCTHPHLTQLNDAALDGELERSRAACAAQIGAPCRTIAYPYGDLDERVARRTEATGYTAGAALPSRLAWSGPYRWPRIGVYNSDVWWRFRLKMMPPMRALRRSSLWPENKG